MRSEVAADVREKQDRLRAFMDERGLGALAIGRLDNFAWATAGADSHVVITSETSFGTLLLTRERQYFIAYNQDYQRVLDEELAGQGYEGVSTTWNGPSPEQEVLRLADGLSLGADTPLPGAQNVNADLQRLHYPLTALDVERCRRIGAECDAMLHEIALEVRPGMTERQIAGIVQRTYTERGYLIDVLLVGADERIAAYRHTIPTQKRAERVVLIHPAAHRWGLHANVTRMLSFGGPPEPTRRAFEAASVIHASVVLNLKPGVPFARILEIEKELHAQVSGADEWTKHFQGGITGYILADPTVCLDPARTVAERQAFDYFCTVTGGKVEELVIVDGAPAEIASAGTWPLETVRTPYGEVRQPALLVL